METASNISEDTLVKEKVQTKFKSDVYARLCKDLREASGKCSFHVVQNRNQEIDLKNWSKDPKQVLLSKIFCLQG